MPRKSFKYEMYHQDNNIQLGNLIDDMYQIHVHFLKLQRRYYRMFKKYIPKKRMNKHLTQLKRTTKPHWKNLPSQACQDVLKRIDLGYQKFFDNIEDRRVGKTTKKVGRPHIKPAHKYNSVTFTQAGWGIDGNRLHIRSIDKHFTFWKHRDWTGKIKTVTIKRDNVGDYYLVLSCENADPSEHLPKTGNRAGIDFGLKTFLTLSDGTKIESPEFFRKGLNAIRSASKALSRKQYLSGGWFRAKRHLNRVYKKITNRRRDWFWKTALKLCRKYDHITIETLNLDAMKKLWGRKVSDLGFGEFLQILEWQCKKFGITFAKADRWEPTTKTCHKCGDINENLTLADRSWVCGGCGTHHDRDINAANMILQAGVPVP